MTEWSKICIAHRVSTIKTSANYDYIIDGHKLQWSNCTRDLGVHMDTDLKFAEHNISITVHIGHSRAALLLKCFHRYSEVLVKAFCTYVHPIL